MRMKQAGFIAAQAAIFVGVLALVSLPVQSTNERQVSTSSAVPGSIAFTSAVSPQGLQLKMWLNSTSIPSHGAIAAQIEVLNTLNLNVSISMPSYNESITGLGQTMESLNELDYTCGQDPSDFLADSALFQGHITAANLSSAGTPLRLDTLFEPPGCGFIVGEAPATFLPNGDQVIVGATNETQSQFAAAVNATTFYCTGSGLGGHGGEIDCGNTTGLVGYWNASIPIENGQLGLDSPALVYFPPGEYTIVACDAFNQYLYATFLVQSPG